MAIKLLKKKQKKHNTYIEFENKNRLIEIKNQTDYTDYGYSIFIYNTENTQKKSYNIIVNVPYEKQDNECKFIKKSAEYLEKNFLEIINKAEWFEIK
jgi:hypothetical protein